MATPAAPPAAAAAPPPGNPGDITKPVQNIDELKARISHKDVGGKPWHQPLFNPFQDPVRCLLGYCCGPCMHGMTVAEVEGDDNWIVPCLIFYVTSGFCVGWYFGQPNRSKIRQKYGLEEAPYSDCITWTGLCCFAVCQESAEVDFQKKNGGGAAKPAAPAPPPATTAAPPVQSI